MTEIAVGALVGRRVLVTGGSRGIGAEIVRRLACDGAAVAFTYGASNDAARELVDEVSGRGGIALAIRADSGDPVEVEGAVAHAAADLGGLDVLVNNAGVNHVAPLDQYPQDQFDRLVAVNIGGVYSAVRAALGHLGAGSRIINIGSINADRVQAPGLSVYAMTKGAVASFTRGLARELGPRGITVNNVQPGPIASDMNPDVGEHADAARRVIALGRYGKACDIAAVVSFLAGPDSTFVTGADWNVDGGFTA